MTTVIFRGDRRAERVVITLVWLFVAASAGCSPSPQAAPAAAGGTSPPVASAPAAAIQGLSNDPIENAFRAIEDGVRESPRDSWDPAYIVGRVGRDPNTLLAWVRERTTWVPYRGKLRGPVGVLLDRQGNSLDRALLVAALLREAGSTVRLAHATLPEATARTLLPRLVVDRFARDGIVDDLGTRSASETAEEVVAAVRPYRLDEASIRRTLTAQASEANQVVSTLIERVAVQTGQLLGAVGHRSAASDHAVRASAALASLRDHWWVQRYDGSRWIDLDLLSLNAADTSFSRPVPETLSDDRLPLELMHSVVVRVIAEQSMPGNRSESTVLEHALNPFDTIGVPIMLRSAPVEVRSMLEAANKTAEDLRAAALKHHEWVVILQVGPRVVAKALLRDEAATGAAGAKGSSGGLGGLAGGIANILAGTDPAETKAMPVPGGGAVFSAAWLEFEIRAPGVASRRIRRTIFDAIGPAVRAQSPAKAGALDDQQRAARSLALMRETEILPLVCWLAPEYLTYTYGQSVLANRDLVKRRSVGTLPQPFETGAGIAFVPPPGSLHQLAHRRFEWSRLRDRVFLDGVNILTRHRFLAPSTATIVLRDVIDIVANEVEVDLLATDGFAARLEQGVIDTNIEALLRTTAPAAANVANAYAVRAEDWVTVSAASQLTKLSQHPEDARRRAAADLSGGHVIVAPIAPVAVGSEKFSGWWRVDPVNGHVLGMTAEGAGGSQIFDRLYVWGAENILLIEAVSESFFFAYYLCNRRAIECLPEAIANALLTFGLNQGFGRRDFWRRLYNNTEGGWGTGGGGPRFGPGATQPMPSAPTVRAGAGGSGTPSAGATGGGGRPPSGGPAGPKGPFRLSDENREWARAIPDHEVIQYMGGVKTLDGADNAAQTVYNDRVAKGWSEADAYSASRDTWFTYLKRYSLGGDLYGRVGKRDTVPLPPIKNPADGQNQGGVSPTAPTEPAQGAQNPCQISPCAESVSGKLLGGLISVQETPKTPGKR